MVEVDLNWYPVIRWTFFSDWTQRDCLYAYHVGSTIHYVGEAVYSSIGNRYDSHELDGVNKQIRSLSANQDFSVLVGKPTRRDGKPVSDSLIHDIESVLIFKLKPTANIQKKESITVDYPLSIGCKASWPTAWDFFYHDGKPVLSPRQLALSDHMRATLAQATNPNPLSALFSSNPFAPSPDLSFLSRLATPAPVPKKQDGPSFSDLIGLSDAFKYPHLMSDFSKPKK